MTPWFFSPLERSAYSLIMIDCPWHFKTRSIKGWGKSAQRHYRTMGLPEIAALPVADLAAKDCVLWMWATAPMLEMQLGVMKGWGFEYKTSGCWVKTTKHGKISFGAGYLFRNSHEIVLIGTRGKPKTKSRSVRSVLLEGRREHSRKPDGAYAAARALVPNGRAADVFSREPRTGWECFGDEAEKFAEAAE